MTAPDTPFQSVLRDVEALEAPTYRIRDGFGGLVLESGATAAALVLGAIAATTIILALVGAREPYPWEVPLGLVMGLPFLLPIATALMCPIILVRSRIRLVSAPEENLLLGGLVGVTYPCLSWLVGHAT